MLQEELTEKQIQDSIFDFLIQSRFLVMRINQGASVMRNAPDRPVRFVRFVIWSVLGMPRVSKGIADILGFSPNGRLYAFEVKRPGKEASKEQSFFLAQVEDRGGIGRVVSSLDEVIQLVNEELGHILF